MSYMQYGFTITVGQKQALRGAHQKQMGHTLRLSPDQLSGDDKLGITKTQHNKIQKAKAERRGIELKLSKTQMVKNGGFIGALSLSKLLLPSIMKLAPKIAAPLFTGALSWLASAGFKKAVGRGTKRKKRRTTKKVATKKVATKEGGLVPLLGWR